MRFTVLLPFLMTAACGPGIKPETYPSPDALMDASLAAYAEGDCGDAERGFQYLTFQLPARDARVAEARYLLADCRLRGGEHLEAARQFRRVAVDFPQHARAPWALLREGDAYARLWKRPELDPTYGRTALSSYQELLSTYPESEPADSARVRARTLQNQFAEKDLKTGEFYFRHGAYDSAIIYFRSVVARWPDSRWAPDALIRLVETYEKLGYREEMQETCSHLRRFYADAEGLADACPADDTTAVSRSP